MSKKETYDREAVGERLKKRRKQMGLSRREISDKIGIVEKYYADIERGTCGMSVETMMALAKFYHLSLDEFIYGDEAYQSESEQETLLQKLENLSAKEQKYCAEMLSLLIRGMTETA